MTETAREVKEQVGPYKLIRAIGAGGSARIDLARIERAYNFQRHVVVKRPLEHLRGDPNVAASLRREARIGGRLRHPNLVAVLDAGMHDNYDYLVLEYVHGTSLRTLMQADASGGQVREVPLPVALGIVIDVARALHDAHELTDEKGAPLGLVHRDVSPGNVLLGLDGAVKLADFGIAKETRVATLSGSMHGTVTYMAPEQCRGHAFDRRADIFSIGVILYELVTKQRLFWADNDVASLHRVLSGEVTRPRRVDPQISPALDDIIMMALAQDPSARFATARAFADALEALAATEGHVVGARWLARTLEEVVGAKHAPWIAASTVVERFPTNEGSLVQVIERLPTDGEPVEPTFGPRDPRVAEEGELPAAPIIPRRSTTAVVPRRKRWLIPATAVAIAGGVAIGWKLTARDAAPEPETIEMHTTPPPVPTKPAPVETPAKPDTIDAITGADEPVAAETVVTDTPKHPGRGKKPPHHQTTSPPDGSGSGSAVAITTPPPPEPSGSAAGSAAQTRLPNVEWKPTMLLPTDKAGSGMGSNAKKP